jgi:hypothetical protein
VGKKLMPLPRISREVQTEEELRKPLEPEEIERILKDWEESQREEREISFRMGYGDGKEWAKQAYFYDVKFCVERGVFPMHDFDDVIEEQKGNPDFQFDEDFYIAGFQKGVLFVWEQLKDKLKPANDALIEIAATYEPRDIFPVVVKETRVVLGKDREKALKLGMEEGRRWAEREATESELDKLERFGVLPRYISTEIHVSARTDGIDEVGFREGFIKGAFQTIRR